jgi:hypothetical protein
MKTFTAALLAALALAAPAGAGPNLLVGVSDDLLKWTQQLSGLLRVERDLGVQADRITLQWRPGKTAAGRDEAAVLQRIQKAFAAQVRVVVSVYGPPDQAPVDTLAQTQYCSFLASLVRYQGVGDVVVWNEPNSTAFWRPQSPVAYESLLARCWDAVHAVRASANVIAASAPRGATGPAKWFRALGDAYRASGRTRPIFDTVGHNAYPDSDAELPSARHTSSSTIAQGDYDKLMAALTAAFTGTGQPVPGTGSVTIWYMEDGYQTLSPQSAAYTGVESAMRALSPALQARRVRQAIELAYCQPAVGAFFNFQLYDERSLSGWQSGVLYADGTPKPSYDAFKAVAAAARAGTIDCSGTLSQWKAASTSPSGATRKT